MNWLKENWFKLGILIVIIFLAGYAAYYFSVTIPATEKVKSDQQQAQALKNLQLKTADEIKPAQNQATTTLIASKPNPVTSPKTTTTPATKTKAEQMFEDMAKEREAEKKLAQNMTFSYDDMIKEESQLNSYPVGINLVWGHSPIATTTCVNLQENSVKRDNIFWVYTDKLNAFIAKYDKIAPKEDATNKITEDVINNYVDSTFNLTHLCALFGYPLPLFYPVTN